MYTAVVTALAVALVQAAGPAVPDLRPPTKEAAAPTEAEMADLRAGYALFAAKKFDEAITAFQAMLTANPDSVGAMHEMAMAYLAKGDHPRAIETATRCAAYRFPELDTCLALIGTAFDQMGEPVPQSWGFPGVREWLDAHRSETDAFLAWDKGYAWR